MSYRRTNSQGSFTYRTDLEVSDGERQVWEARVGPDRRGLKVQLYSWNVPAGWRARSTRFWSQTFAT